VLNLKQIIPLILILFLIFFLVSQQGSIKIEKHIADTVVAECLKSGFKLPGPSIIHHHSEAVVMPGACTKEIYLKNRHTGNWLHPPGLLIFKSTPVTKSRVASV
jgi:hypothetical protein